MSADFTTKSNKADSAIAEKTNTMLTAKSKRKEESHNALSCSCAGFYVNPLRSQIAILSIIINSTKKIVVQNRKKLVAIQEKIDLAVSELSIVS